MRNWDTWCSSKHELGSVGYIILSHENIYYGGCRGNYRGIVNWFIYFWQKSLTNPKVSTISKISMVFLKNVAHKNDKYLDQFKSSKETAWNKY